MLVGSQFGTPHSCNASLLDSQKLAAAAQEGALMHSGTACAHLGFSLARDLLKLGGPHHLAIIHHALWAGAEAGRQV